MRISDWSSDVCSSDLFAKENEGGDVLILYGDVPFVPAATMRAMIDRLNASDAPAVVVLAFEPADAQQYGRVITEGDRVVKMVEHKDATPERSEEHTSELQSLMRISYAVFCLKKKKKHDNNRL